MPFSLISKSVDYVVIGICSFSPVYLGFMPFFGYLEIYKFCVVRLN